MDDPSKFIEELVINIMEDIKKDMRGRDMFVSGKTESLWAVKKIVSSTSVEVQLWGPNYTRNLVSGRGPSSGGSSGGQTLQQKLLEWIETRGIRPKEKNMTQESLSWAMARHMHTQGNRGTSPSGKGRYAGKKIMDILEKNITDSRIDAAVDAFSFQLVDKVFIDINEVFR